MDKKKLIGTIIGVTLFALLIAGATFAWLTFSANVSNGTYNSATKEFVINYTGGTAVESVPMLNSADSTTASKLSVSAYRTSASTEGTLYIKMTNTVESLLSTSGVLNYAVCSGTSTAASCTALTEGSTGVLTGGTGTITSTGEKVLYETDDIPTTQTYYWIFFWLDASKVTNEMLETDENGDPIHTFSGYIHASAQQR